MDTRTAPIAIGALSGRTGTSVETIRYYERAGLLPEPARSPGGYRLYGTEHLKRLVFIRRARALGFSIDEVRTLLRLADERRRPCAEVRVVAEAHLEEVHAKIADLRAMERVLTDTVARCADGRRSPCPLIEALYREAATPAAPALRRADRTRARRSPSGLRPSSTDPTGSSRPARSTRPSEGRRGFRPRRSAPRRP
jgi:MerR family mercuric resistance operon transcriptional regulator